ncbi:hypothetical protein SUGI_0940490 [Cryptomeria japonica]|nr:hypothetical protein SUGI_0940490 [Cryptomeria japonica]
MAGEFSSQLEIPDEIASRMNVRVCKDVILTGPSGHLWHVKLCHTDVSAYFTDGWQGFVADNRIKAKDILVFRHARDMHFVVQVFGEHEQNHTLCDPEVEILWGKQKEIGSADSVGIFNSSTSTWDAVPKVASSSFMRANSVLNPVNSMEPMFSLTLTKSATSAYYNLTIPKDFAKRWLPNKKVKLTFVHHKNPGEWQYMLETRKGGREYGVRWKRFVTENKLHKGDICVFKLMNGIKHIFMVYVNK